MAKGSTKTRKKGKVKAERETKVRTKATKEEAPRKVKRTGRKSDGLVHTSDLAKQFGKPATRIRSILRSMEAFDDKKYTVYAWKPGSKQLARVERFIEKQLASETHNGRKARRGKTAVKSAKGKKGKKAKVTAGKSKRGRPKARKREEEEEELEEEEEEEEEEEDEDEDEEGEEEFEELDLEEEEEE